MLAFLSAIVVPMLPEAAIGAAGMLLGIGVGRWVEARYWRRAIAAHSKFVPK